MKAPNSYLAMRVFSSTSIDTSVLKDLKDEPRFLEQVELFFNRAASKTGISEDYLQLIRECDTVFRF